MMTGDFMQICVITKNELIKSVRGRKFLLSLAIVLLVFGLITALQFITNSWDRLDSVSEIMTTYMSMFSTVILMVVALLSSVALVSEFEERTALILFTRPVRRTSVLLGKVFSCLILEAAIILAYYVLVMAVSQYKAGSISEEMLVSLGMSILYAFAASGIAFVISAFFKKGSVCTIVSLLVLLVIIPIFAGMIDGSTWFMLNTAGDCIITCVPEYVDSYNSSLILIGEVAKNAADILGGIANPDLQMTATMFHQAVVTGGFASLDPAIQAIVAVIDQFFMSCPPVNDIGGMVAVLKMMTSSEMFAPIESPDILLEGAVLVLWGATGYLIAWFRFVRREF